MNKLGILVTYWYNGLKRVYIPDDLIDKKDLIVIEKFLNEPFCDEVMPDICCAYDIIYEHIKTYDDDECPTYWNTGIDDRISNVLEVIIFGKNKKEILYSCLDPICSFVPLKAVEFMCENEIPNSSLESSKIYRHSKEDITLGDLFF